MRFMNKRLSIHHVGGRSGSRGFPVLDKFEKDIINVLYDADPECLAQIQERNRHLQSELHVLPYCLGEACRTTHFNINYDPYTSSLLNSNPDYESYYFFYGDHDYLWSEATKTMEKRHIEVVTIDDIFQSVNDTVPPPDFLSIDTQGSEYEILLGAKETLKSSVVALVIEAEFHPLYKDQKLFGDLMKLLSDQGFDFVGFRGMLSMSPFRAPIGLRGEGFHVCCDALFLRRVDKIEKDMEDEVKCYVMLRKLAFMAIVFNQFEYGLQCLSRCRALGIQDSIAEELEDLSYCRFLRDLETKMEGMAIVFPETFALKYTFEASKARFEGCFAHASTGVMDSIKAVLRRIPILFPLLKGIKQGFIKVVAVVKSISPKRHSDVEAVLIRYGLESQAEILRRNRVVQSPFASAQRNGL